ncbi:MAG: SufE family protein [Bacteroidetes bacterium]|nr:SufE family protein [Bacteroidota bacterium]MBM3424608.1 SufE family protein [Bacteroidota bacterium]
MRKSINELQDEVINEFAIFEDWMDKYEYLIDLGKELPLIDEAKKSEDRLIHGCQSRVWVDAQISDGMLVFTADSEAIITKGIISLLIRILSNQTPENIVKSELYFIGKIGLQEHLSPTRANGLTGMINRLKSEALKQLTP